MKAKLGAWVERLRSSLWVLPALMVLFALYLGTALSRVEVADGPLGAVLFTGSAAGARSLLSTVAGAMITTIGVVFSMTVVALQMAAGQYSPRIMRNFLRDRGNQWVLAVFLGTFAYAVAVLRVIREAADGQQANVPSLAISVGIVLILVSLGTLVYFIQHLTSTIRVERILRDAGRTAMGTITSVYGARGEPEQRAELPEVPEEALTVPACRTGRLQAVAPEELVAWARQHDLVVRLRPLVGEYVVEGGLVAWVWRAADGRGPDDADSAAGRIDRAVSIGFERTNQQDVAFGVRQVVDIAVRALSPGVNDPTTAVDAIGTLTALLSELARRDLGDVVCHDDAGTLRVAMPRPALPEYLDLCCDQIRRYGAAEPAVTARLLRMLIDVARLVRTDAERAAVARHSRLIVEDASRETRQPEDVRDLPGLADLVVAALQGRSRPEPTTAT